MSIAPIDVNNVIRPCSAVKTVLMALFVYPVKLIFISTQLQTSASPALTLPAACFAEIKLPVSCANKNTTCQHPSVSSAAMSSEVVSAVWGSFPWGGEVLQYVSFRRVGV